jgi:hypothetical protein
MDRLSKNLIPVLVASAFISISLFEVLAGICLVLFLYRAVSGRKRPSGMLLTPLALYAVPTLASTVLFNRAYLMKALGQAIFPFLYIGKDHTDAGDHLFLKINRLLILIGVLIIPVIAYKVIVLKWIGPIWGGPFEVGVFYTFFSLAALSLFFYSRKGGYLFLFFIFSAIIFFSTKRAPVIGFAAALICFAIVNRRSVDRRIFFAVAAGFLVIAGIAACVLVQRDNRFHTFYEIVVGNEQINDKTLDVVTSIRWTLFQRGIRVIASDIRNGRVMNLLIGHGLRSGQELVPKAPPGYDSYESVFVVSELIERGMVGLLGILFIFFYVFRFIARFTVTRKEDFLQLPFILLPAALLAGMIFTGFWDAIMPLYLLLFGLVENLRKTEENA